MNTCFLEADFFVEFERPDRHKDKFKYDKEIRLDFKYLHPKLPDDAPNVMALCRGTDVISEKPIALYPWNMDTTAYLEEETGQ